MPRENTWRDQFLQVMQERATARGWRFAWLVLNVVNQRGVPDTWVHLYAPEYNKRSCALLEFKTGKGVVSAAQKARLAGFDDLGVHAYVVRLKNRDEATLHYYDDNLTCFDVWPASCAWEELARRILEIMRG